MFTKTCKYGLRALIFVGQKSETGAKAGIKEIASEIDAPEYFIAKILQDLSRKGLVQSSKGPTGGFFLDKKGMQTSIADIVKAIDGENLFTNCGLGLKKCSELKPCPIHNDFKAIRENIKCMLQTAKIAEFTKGNDKLPTYLKS